MEINYKMTPINAAILSCLHQPPLKIVLIDSIVHSIFCYLVILSVVLCVCSRANSSCHFAILAPS